MPNWDYYDFMDNYNRYGSNDDNRYRMRYDDRYDSRYDNRYDNRRYDDRYDRSDYRRDGGYRCYCW